MCPRQLALFSSPLEVKQQPSVPGSRQWSLLMAMFRKMRELARAILWVVRAAKRFRPKIARIVVLDLVSLLGWLAALAGFGRLLRALDSGSQFEVGPLQVSLADGASATFGICGSLAAVGGFGALCHYSARRQSAAVAGGLMLDLRARLLRIVSGAAGQEWRSLVGGAPRKWIRRLTVKPATMAALALWSLLKSLLPFGIVIVTGAYLFLVDSLLSVMLLPLLLPYLFSLSLAYSRVADSRRRYLDVSNRALSEIIDALSDVASHEHPPESVVEGAKRQLRADEHLESVELFFELRLVVQRVKLINGIFDVVCFAAVLSFFVPLIATTERSWADPLVYVIGLRLMLHAAQKVSGGLAMVSRRLPEIGSLALFLDISEGRAELPPEGSPQRQLFTSASEDFDLEGEP